MVGASVVTERRILCMPVAMHHVVDQDYFLDAIQSDRDQDGSVMILDSSGSKISLATTLGHADIFYGMD